MAATMARQEGWVQLEPSNMQLTLNMAKMAKWGCLRTTMEETLYLIEKPWGKVCEEKTSGVEFFGHRNVEAAIETQPAMVLENHTDSCLPCLNCTAQNWQTRRRRKGMDASPPNQLWQPTPEPMPFPPGMPPAPPIDAERAHAYQIKGVPPRYVYIHTPLRSAQFFNLDAFAKDRKHNKGFNLDLLTAEGKSTG